MTDKAKVNLADDPNAPLESELRSILAEFGIMVRGPIELTDSERRRTDAAAKDALARIVAEGSPRPRLAYRWRGWSLDLTPRLRPGPTTSAAVLLTAAAIAVAVASRLRGAVRTRKATPHSD